MQRVIVLGGGIAGLAAARKAREGGAHVVLIEKNPTVGGLTRSIVVDGWVFDYAGHFLHLSRVTHPTHLGNGNHGTWKAIFRKAGCWVAGRMIDAPFQYHIRDLPEPVRSECMDDLRTALDSTQNFQPETGESLLSFFQRTFGRGITRYFLLPYNQKLLACDISDFPAHRLNRFFPFPDPVALRRSLDTKTDYPTYNALFWYPEHGGIEQLVRQLPFSDVLYAPCDGIDVTQRTLIAEGTELSWDALVSTLPLPDLLHLGPTQWQNDASRLAASGVAVLQLGVLGPPPEILRGWHWIYVADPTLPFFRVGVYSNISAKLAPRGCHSLYVETGFALSSPPDWAFLTPRILHALEDAGFVDPTRIEILLRHTLVPAYVHFDSRYDRLVPFWRQELKNQGIFLAGRYGTWDYMGMEDAIFQGEEAAAQAVAYKCNIS